MQTTARLRCWCSLPHSSRSCQARHARTGSLPPGHQALDGKPDVKCAQAGVKFSAASAQGFFSPARSSSGAYLAKCLNEHRSAGLAVGPTEFLHAVGCVSHEDEGVESLLSPLLTTPSLQSLPGDCVKCAIKKLYCLIRSWHCSSAVSDFTNMSGQVPGPLLHEAVVLVSSAAEMLPPS